MLVNDAPDLTDKKVKKVYVKGSMKTVNEKEHLKKKPKKVSHGTSTNYKARGSMNPTNIKVKQRKKVLTDGGYMWM